MNKSDAITHLNRAIELLSTDVHQIPVENNPDLKVERVVKMCGPAIDLERVDGAVGPRGESMFGHIAVTLQEAYVELVAAREALNGQA